MFTVTPIGSCRITTPLRHGQAAHGLGLNLTRCYGYCHSPAEAVQMARFMRGEVTIPDDIWPLVSRSHDQAALRAQAPRMSDLYVVEIASAKELTIDGVSIQLNYLRSGFADFFADKGRTQRFWDLAESGAPGAMPDFLDAEWSATAQQRREAATLGRIRRTLVTRDSLRDSLATLRDLLPDLLVVTHVDAVKPDGQRIKSRASLIEMVRAETAALGLECCDPTALMAEFGQSEAIEDDSTSLAHFTKSFGDALMADWMRVSIAPRSDAMIASRPEVLRSQIEADIAQGRFVQAATRLASLPRRFADLTAHVAALLNRARAEFWASSGVDVNARVQRALDLGLFDAAAEVAAQAPGGVDALPCPLLTQLALAAEASGDVSNAAGFAIAACRQTQDAARAAQVVAGLVHRHGLSLTAHLEENRIARIQALLSPEQVAEALQRTDAPVATLIPAGMPGAALARIAELAGPMAGVPALAHWRSAQPGGRIREAGLVALLDRWVQAATGLRDPLARARALAHLQAADPRHAGLRAALRDARADLVARIRAAGKAADVSGLQKLAPELRSLPGAKPEYDLWTARLHFAEGRFAEAIDAGLHAAAAMESKINIWVLLMRAAMRVDDMGLADRASARVVTLSDGFPKLKAEAQKIRSALSVEV